MKPRLKRWCRLPMPWRSAIRTARRFSPVTSPVATTSVSPSRIRSGACAPRGRCRDRISTPGLAWHVDGSLLGLDVGLAKLGLRRLGMTIMLDPPTLASNERDTFVASAALTNAFALTDAGRDAIADAIEAGRRRVKTLIDNPDGVEAVGDAIGMDGWRRRAARWTVVHDPDDLESLFSLSELAILGDLRTADVQPWGMSAIASSGCLCTEVAMPGRWRALTGRPQLGILATAVADLNLHVARMLKELALPAGLAKYVLSAAVQDFIDEVRPTDADDWLTLVRGDRRSRASVSRTMSPPPSRMGRS